ncbi:Filament-like plant protein 7 [Acorus calamus]|uniref:Filament-like plant protein 7 n=1 Tax=Acorus calamus TaxID=4465 RepID=A0AAV9FAY2_ACOCL|nr:Filament-like plant protein 7 [Acorus calamus]
MDHHKTWLWRRKSSEKTITAHETESAAELEKSLVILNEKLSSALSESYAKDDILVQRKKVAEDAIAGWEKARAEATSNKRALDDALQQRSTAEEMIANLNAALKESMQKLHDSKEEYEQKIHDIVMKNSRELDRIQTSIEDKLAETSARLSELGVENNNLRKEIEVKEKVIEDLTKSKSRAEADFNALTVRLNSTDKNNASLRYEVCMLEKELEIRSQEREFNMRSADASHKQYVESVKKIAKLESECQKLRVLVRKRLPGPAALAKMRSEVELLGRDGVDSRNKRSNHPMGGTLVKHSSWENYHDASNKRVDPLLERLVTMEEENKILKEELTKKNVELQSSRTLCARTSSKLSQVEAQLGELTKGDSLLELARRSPASYELPLASISENGGNDDNVSCAESWASALIVELDHFKNGKQMASSCRSFCESDLSLLDDFVEMERMAIVSVDKSSECSNCLMEEHNPILAPSETNLLSSPSQVTGKEIILVANGHAGSESTNYGVKSNHLSVENDRSWIQDILQVIFEKHHATQKSLDYILQEVRIALKNMNHSSGGNSSSVNGYSSSKPPQKSSDSYDGTNTVSQSQSNLEKSICKVIELLEGVRQPPFVDYGNQQILSGGADGSVPNKSSAAPNVARIFQWKNSELDSVLQHFLLVCNDLLRGKANIEKFVAELTTTLEWIMNHCFSLQDVSSMRDAIRKEFDWDETHSECQVEMGSSPNLEIRKVTQECQPNVLYILSQMEEIELKLKQENKKMKDEITGMETGKKELEERLQSETNKNKSLITQLQESAQNISSLQVELAAVKESQGLGEDEIGNHYPNEDINSHVAVAKVEVQQKSSSLQNSSYGESEATCQELQLHLDSVGYKELPKHEVDQEERLLRTDWEISAASEKLAECQETILNLGKQLKALASPRDAVLFEKAMPNPLNAKNNRHLPLRDQMLVEDESKSDELNSPKTKEIICTTTYSPSTNEPKNKGLNTLALALVVPKKRRGGFGLLKRILSRKRRERVSL